METILTDLKWQVINHLYIGNFLFFLVASFLIYSYYFLRNIVIRETILKLTNFHKQLPYSLGRQIAMFSIFYLFDIRSLFLYAIAYLIIVLIQFPNIKRMKAFGYFFLFIYALTFSYKFNCLLYVTLLDALIVNAMQNIGMDTKVFYFNVRQKNKLKEIYNNICQLTSLILSNLELKLKNISMKILLMILKIWDWGAFLYYRTKYLLEKIMHLMSLKTLITKLRSQKEKELKKKRAMTKTKKLRKEKKEQQKNDLETVEETIPDKEEIIVKYEVS